MFVRTELLIRERPAGSEKNDAEEVTEFRIVGGLGTTEDSLGILREETLTDFLLDADGGGVFSLRLNSSVRHVSICSDNFSRWL
mmetsp:Transcript_899/g.1773  ORF Transcript_899/g.1773 Transcript_899/m.1773 type:complete len:84 (+) Transcript_899:787-1038(+)